MRLVAATTIALVAFVVPAHAAPTIVGTSCGLVAVAVPESELGGQNTFNGLFVGAAIAVDVGQPTANPATIAVTCSVRVNGEVQASAPSLLTTTAVAPTLGVAQFHAEEGALIEVCTAIVATSASGTNPYGTQCVEARSSLIPPVEICDADQTGLVCPLLGTNRIITVVPLPFVE